MEDYGSFWDSNAAWLWTHSIIVLFTQHRRKLQYSTCLKSESPGEIKLHDRAICIAVFCLSPVSIQKFIPAFLSVSIVSGTPS